MLQAATPFIRAAEIWLPHGEVLKLGNGDYGQMQQFADVSSHSSFAKGEGLPGKAWAEGRPIVLKGFDGSYFKRQEAARAAGLTCAVAIPVFAQSELRAVLVILCGGDKEGVGAIEIWESEGERLKLDNGYYGKASEFEAVSKSVSFGRGEGLPGGVWASKMPLLMRDIGSGHGFVRSQSAGEVGLTWGLGLPVPCPDGDMRVVCLLSASDTPLARRFEIWDARSERFGKDQIAARTDGICEREGPLWPKQNPPVDMVTVRTWKGPIGQVLGAGLPCIIDNGMGLPADYRLLVALPIYRDDELASIVAWYL